jgi:hypothetical protein
MGSRLEDEDLSARGQLTGQRLEKSRPTGNPVWGPGGELIEQVACDDEVPGAAGRKARIGVPGQGFEGLAAPGRELFGQAQGLGAAVGGGDMLPPCLEALSLAKKLAARVPPSKQKEDGAANGPGEG